MGHHYEGLFEGWELRLARKIVWAYRKKYRVLQKDDIEDLLQEVLVHWLFVKGRYCEQLEKIMGTTVANTLKKMVRDRSAEKRRAFFTTEDIEGVQDEAEHALPYGEDSYGELAAYVARLNEQQRLICRLLMDGHSISSLSRKLNIHRSTVHREIQRMRNHFEEWGLREFL
ncbi:MAG: hypothetical protein KKH94_01675 [Candidatus Omnitrophica bacterium]|nr:hypothetical protein [Candidatus Omnitrophota bacterium]